jgi:hypothetical protein
MHIPKTPIKTTKIEQTTPTAIPTLTPLLIFDKVVDSGSMMRFPEATVIGNGRHSTHEVFDVEELGFDVGWVPT